MKTFFVLCALSLLAGCATTTRVAPGMPMTTAPRLASDLSGRYSNVGWVHSPDENHAIEAYLDVALGAASYPDAYRGAIVLRAEEEKIVLLHLDGNRVSRQTTLTRNRDYRMTTDGIELTRFSEGSGPEGVFSMKVSTRILIRVREDGSLVLKAHDDVRAVALWPYRDSRDVWYEFKKEANRVAGGN